ncbi:hypothetical protein AB0L40_17545 [Patulibacter sp. NPDC049589]|uniref:hypothetical protein n=1 Tax=Patulibacter sp. NPDC049589 TaxID=3154731 RepID=UPI00342C0659
MTSPKQHPDPRPGPSDPSRLRDRGLRLARRLTTTLLALSTALVLGLSGLAAATAGSLPGSRNAAALVAPGHVAPPPAAASSTTQAPAVTSGAS